MIETRGRWEDGGKAWVEEVAAEYVDAANWQVWAIGQYGKRGRFQVRRVVWGRLLARAEKRPGEKIVKAAIMVKTE